MPPKPVLSFTSLEEFTNEHVVIKPVVENSKAKVSEAKPKAVRKNNGAPIIKDWVSDSEEKNMSQTKIEKKTAKPSFVKIYFIKAKQTNKTDRKTAKQVEHNRQNTHIPRGNQRNWNNMMSQRLGSNVEMFNKACYVCGSFDHLQVDCNYQRVVKPVWNNAKRVNHQNFAKKTHPFPNKNMVLRAVLIKTGLVSVNTIRQVNVAHSKTIRVNTVKDKNVNAARPKAVVNAVRLKAVVNVAKGNNINVVKASACWVWKPKTNILDHVSKHNSASITLKKFDYVDVQGRSNLRERISYTSLLAVFRMIRMVAWRRRGGGMGDGHGFDVAILRHNRGLREDSKVSLLPNGGGHIRSEEDTKPALAEIDSNRLRKMRTPILKNDTSKTVSTSAWVLNLVPKYVETRRWKMDHNAALSEHEMKGSWKKKSSA
ncbi:hypothetical protein Tco_0355091 [Tanacetum coccineum]